jgi:Ca-activated chloride channel family protein
MDNPLSTFSIDVDTGSYSNIRRYLNDYRMPPKDAVRIEEMINYFEYDYPEPKDIHPFSITTEISSCPWEPSHLLLHIGARGKSMTGESLPPSNLVFLLDVSGSMEDPDKLPLLVSSFKLLVPQLNAGDKVAIVVYAGAAGLVLPPVPGTKKDVILAALDKLTAGGSTAGSAGIQLAYQIAAENFIPNGNNRIILATDGDFNIGVSSTSELIRLIEEKRESGIFLTTLGFGSDNLKDNRLEQLADKGNGSYHYIDNILEGKKVFVHDLRGTLFTIAKDVKIQVEFNPVKVDSYRLIGYENRVLAKEDFADDKKDAGELGAGHTVTALYEIVPVKPGEKNPASGAQAVSKAPDVLRYQETTVKPEALNTAEMALVKLRYKKPREEVSQLVTQPVSWEEGALKKAPGNITFSTAVAMFGMLLKKSEYAGKITYDDVLAYAKDAVGLDIYGYRAEFLHLVSVARRLEQ